MGRKAMWGAALVAVALSLPAGAWAQMRPWQDVQVSDMETVRDKFIALAGAFDESQYDWRPMEGVRSVREVLGLAIAEANLFPTAWGAGPGPNAAAGFGAELQRAAALSQDEMISELETSFEYMIGVARGMDEDDRVAEATYFDQTQMPVHAHISSAMADMHEHLGQLIAYARTNHVVPPWSMGN